MQNVRRMTYSVGLLSMVGGTALVWWFAGWFWKQGLRNYSGASA